MTSETSVLLHPMLSNAKLHAALLIFLVEHCVTNQKKRVEQETGVVIVKCNTRAGEYKTLDAR